MELIRNKDEPRLSSAKHQLTGFSLLKIAEDSILACKLFATMGILLEFIMDDGET
jgi:hypothetical protein